MALIGIYSDVHVSHNSSIMPAYLIDDTYSTRLNMCKQSIKWAYAEFINRNVDMIINCGDTFNSHVVSSDELSAMADVIEEINIPLTFPNYTLIGNHDKFNNVFNSLSWMKLIEDVTLVNDYIHLAYDDTDVYCISFYDAPEFINKVNEMLKVYPKECTKSILFMHGDINGSWLSGTKRIENHIPTDFLTQYFDIVINGHIHCHELIYNKNDKRIFNIGSLTSHSFADSNNHIPACYILNTKTGEIEQITNPHAILFKSYEIMDEINLNRMFEDITKFTNKVIIKIKCSVDIKEEIEKVINNLNNIIKYKFIINYNKEINDNDNENNKIDISVDIKDEFINFLTKQSDLKANIEDYVYVIN